MALHDLHRLPRPVGQRRHHVDQLDPALAVGVHQLVDAHRAVHVLPLEEHVAIPFMAALADALSYLHQLGIVYQLVDPGSTMVGGDARSALLSWPVFCVPAGAAVFDAEGTVSIVREDIGRHNAVDKVIGQMLLEDQLPATGLGLFVSGRASFEIVQKAWAAGFAAIVAVSAPSALAVDTARAAGITLVGFARDRHFNLYTDAGHESVAP